MPGFGDGEDGEPEDEAGDEIDRLIRDTNRPQAERLPYMIAEARMIAHYGAGVMTYHGDLTGDGLIPWRLFWLLLAGIRANLALAAANQVRALSIALAGAFGDKSAARRLRKLIEESSGR